LRFKSLDVERQPPNHDWKSKSIPWCCIASCVPQQLSQSRLFHSSARNLVFPLKVVSGSELEIENVEIQTGCREEQQISVWQRKSATTQ
jgi:hypothetical protein